MNKQTLLFKPKKCGGFKKSPLYAVDMFMNTIGLCSKYLLHGLYQSMDRKTTDEYIEVFWRIHFQKSHTRLYATGREYLNPGEAYIFMSNHESWMDIPAIFGAVPSSLRMVAKVGLTKIPVFGHALINAGFVAIDRKNRTMAIKQLEEAKKRLDEGISIWIAPEGTRTRDGSIGAFKKGGFYLARELKKSIVPVYIEGAAEVMPADSMVVRPNRSITVHFCPPVSYHEYIELNRAQLIERVRSAIINKRIELEQKAREAKQ